MNRVQKIEFARRLSDDVDDKTAEMLVDFAENLGLKIEANHVYPQRKKKSEGHVYVPVLTYDGMRTLVFKSGLLEGITPVDFVYKTGTTELEMMRVGVFRKGLRLPINMFLMVREFLTDSFTHRKMPRHMLAKTLKSQALREAFPDILSGMYSQEELEVMGEEFNEVEVVAEQPEKEQALEQPVDQTPTEEKQVEVVKVTVEDVKAVGVDDLKKSALIDELMELTGEPDWQYDDKTIAQLEEILKAEKVLHAEKLKEEKEQQAVVKKDVKEVEKKSTDEVKNRMLSMMKRKPAPKAEVVEEVPAAKEIEKAPIITSPTVKKKIAAKHVQVLRIYEEQKLAENKDILKGAVAAAGFTREQLLAFVNKQEVALTGVTHDQLEVFEDYVKTHAPKVANNETIVEDLFDDIINENDSKI